MISKCENIVINRTKFSEFVDYDPAVEGVENLKLVGYVDGPAGKQNISVDYGALLTKNGEAPVRGVRFPIGNITAESTPIRINVICDKKCGIIIDDNSLDYIQIDDITEKSEIIDSDGEIDIAFANNSYAIGQRTEVLFKDLPGNIKLISRSTGEPFYNGDIGGYIDILTRFIKVDNSLPVMVPVDTYIGIKGHFLPYGGSNIAATALDDSFLGVTSASMKYVDEAVEELKVYTDNELISVEERANEYSDELKAETIETINETKNELSAVDEELNSKIEGLEASLGQSQDDLSKILHIKKYDSIESLEEDAKLLSDNELSRLIALVKQGEDANGSPVYAEYICIDLLTKKFHLLGAVDTVFATDESRHQHGSVVLVANIDENTFNSEKYGKLSATNNSYIAADGYALSPVALVDLYKKHKETQEIIDSNQESFAEEVNSLKDSLEIIFKELDIDDTTSENIVSRIDILDERLNGANNTLNAEIERLKDTIGLNGCHDNCSCEDKNSCSTEGKCTILCRVSENERDISALNEEIIKVDGKRLENVDAIKDLSAQINEIDANTNATLSQLAEAVDAKFDEKAAEISVLSGRIDKNEAKIEQNALKIDNNNAEIGKIYSDLSTLRGTVESINHDNTSIKSQLSANNTSIIEHDSAIDTAKSDISLLRSEAEANNAAHAQFETRLDGVDNRVADITSRVNGIQSIATQGAQALSKASALEIALNDLKISSELSDESIKSSIRGQEERISSLVDDTVLLESQVSASIEKADNALSLSTEAKTVATNAETIATSVETLVNELKTTVDATSTVANEAKTIADEAQVVSQNAQTAAQDAQTAAEKASEEAEKTAIGVKDLVEKFQKSHIFLAKFANGSVDGTFRVSYSDLFGDVDESSIYNLVVIETKVENDIIQPTLSYEGVLNSDADDRRELVVETGLPNKETAITIMAYARALHVREW